MRNAWFDAASSPDSIEYVCAFDSDDTLALEELSSEKKVVGEPLPGSSAVRNWNAAARISTGKYLFVIADDYFPPPDWDKQILNAVESFDPLSQAIVLKVQDSQRYRVSWVQHPVVSRAYFENFGLFSSKYSHLYCDNDFSLRATKTAAILDLRHVVFSHLHPGEADIDPTESQAKGRSLAEPARSQFESDYSLFTRVVGPGLTPRRLFGLVSLFPSVAPVIQRFSALQNVPQGLRREWRRLRKSRTMRRVRRSLKVLGKLTSSRVHF